MAGMDLNETERISFPIPEDALEAINREVYPRLMAEALRVKGPEGQMVVWQPRTVLIDYQSRRAVLDLARGEPPKA
jgi:hypothetical protein